MRELLGDELRTVLSTSTTEYDPAGRVVLTTDPYVDGAGGPILATRTVYDELGRGHRTLRLSGVTVSLVAGETTLVEAGTTLWETRTVYDDQGRVRQSLAADGQVTDYEYDAFGRRIAVIAAPVTLGGQTVQRLNERQDGRVIVLSGDEPREFGEHLVSLGPTTKIAVGNEFREDVFRVVRQRTEDRESEPPVPCVAFGNFRQRFNPLIRPCRPPCIDRAVSSPQCATQELPGQFAQRIRPLCIRPLRLTTMPARSILKVDC